MAQIKLQIFILVISSLNGAFGFVTVPPPGGLCDDPPEVIGSVVLAFNGNESAIRNLPLAMYTCNVGRILMGNKMIFCIPDNTWTAPPVCEKNETSTPMTTPLTTTTTQITPLPENFRIRVLGSNSAPNVDDLLAIIRLSGRALPTATTRRTSEATSALATSPCSNIEEVNNRNCEVEVSYRYNVTLNTCVEVTSCLDAALGVAANNFRLKDNCLAKCSIMMTTTTSAVTTTVNNDMLASPCNNSDEINNKNCETALSYRFNSSSATCEEITSCLDAPLGVPANNFRAKDNCLRKCLVSLPATTTTTSTPPPTSTEPLPTTLETTPEPTQSPDANEIQETSGGTNGPSCLTGVDPSTHSSCLPNSPNLVETTSFEIAFPLDAHNMWRQLVRPPAVDMADLEWHQGLATTAERWAAQCNNVSGEDVSSKRSIPGFGYIGQNLCFSYGYQKSWKDCVTEWAAQKVNWAYGVGPTTGNGNDVKNYVQIIWGNARYIGCGMAQCSDGQDEYIMVCNYASPIGPGGPKMTDSNPNPFATPYNSSPFTTQQK